MKRKLNTIGKTVVIGALVAAPVSAFADIMMGGLGVSPGIALKIASDSNVANELDNSTPKPTSSMVTTVSPSIGLALKKPWGDAYTASYKADVVSYSDSSGDDHSKQLFDAAASYPFTPKSMANLTANYTDGATARGELGPNEDRNTTATKPDEWSSSNVTAAYKLGKRNSVSISGGVYKKRADNNLLAAEGSQGDDDVDSTSLGLGGSLAAGPKTLLTADVSLKNSSFTNVATRDNTDTRFTLGADWRPSALLNLKASLFTGSIDFTDAATSFEDDSVSGYGLTAILSPVAALTVTASMNNTVSPTTDTAYLSVNRASAKLGLGYRINNKLGTNLGLESINTTADKSKTGAVDRDDKEDVVTFNVNYAMRNWLSFELAHRSSTVNESLYTDDRVKSVQSFTVAAKF